MTERNITRAGFVPASPLKGWRSDDMLRPKTREQGSIYPYIPADAAHLVAFAIGELAPAERKALTFIVQNADLIQVEGSEPFLLVPTIPAFLEALATVGAEAEERENDLEDEPQPDDEEDDLGGCEHDGREEELGT